MLPSHPPAVEKHIKCTTFCSNPIALIKESILHKHFYKTGFIVDDSKVEVSHEMCVAIESVMLVMDQRGKLQDEVKGNLATNVRRFELWLATKIGILTISNHMLLHLTMPKHTLVKEKTKGKNAAPRCLLLITITIRLLNCADWNESC